MTFRTVCCCLRQAVFLGCYAYEARPQDSFLGWEANCSGLASCVTRTCRLRNDRRVAQV